MKLITRFTTLLFSAFLLLGGATVQANEVDSKENASTKLSMTRELGRELEDLADGGKISAMRAKLIQGFHDIRYKMAFGEMEEWQADTEVDAYSSKDNEPDADSSKDNEQDADSSKDNERDLQLTCDFCGTQGSCGRSSSLGTYYSVDVNGTSPGDLWLVTCEYPDISAPNCYYPPNYDTDQDIYTLAPGVSIGEASLQCPCCTFIYPRADAGNPPFTDSRCATPGNCDFVERICRASSTTFTCPVGSVMFIVGGASGGASLSTDEAIIAGTSQANGCSGTTSSITCSGTLVAAIAADDCNCVTCSGGSTSLGTCTGPISVPGEGVCASSVDICDVASPTDPPPTQGESDNKVATGGGPGGFACTENTSTESQGDVVCVYVAEPSFPFEEHDSFFGTVCVEDVSAGIEPTNDNCQCFVGIGTLEDIDNAQGCLTCSFLPSPITTDELWEIEYDCSNILTGTCVGRDSNGGCISNAAATTAPPPTPPTTTQPSTSYFQATWIVIHSGPCASADIPQVTLRCDSGATIELVEEPDVVICVNTSPSEMVCTGPPGESSYSVDFTCTGDDQSASAILSEEQEDCLGGTTEAGLWGHGIQLVILCSGMALERATCDPEDTVFQNNFCLDGFSCESGNCVEDTLTIPNIVASITNTDCSDANPMDPVSSTMEETVVVGLQPSCHTQEFTEYNMCLDLKSLSGKHKTWMESFSKAKDKWQTVIVGNLPSVSSSLLQSGPDYTCTGYPETVDDVYICGQEVVIDGPGNVLGAAGPIYSRGSGEINPRTDEEYRVALTGRMFFDTADIAMLEDNGEFDKVVFHEMGHVLGIGSLWVRNGLYNEGSDQYASGTLAEQEWKALGCSGPLPVETDGGEGTAGSHWDETCLQDEVMSGALSGPFQPPSRITIGSFEDMGYQVVYSLASDYTLNDLGSCGSFCPEAGRRLGKSNKRRAAWVDLDEDGMTAVMRFAKMELTKMHTVAEAAMEGHDDDGIDVAKDINVLYMDGGGKMHSVHVTWDQVKDLKI